MYEPPVAERGTGVHIFRLPGGERVMVRPIRLHDAGRLQSYLRDLSVETRRHRFLGAVSEFAPAQLDRLTRMDHPGELALLAFADTGGEHVVAEAIMVTAARRRAPARSRCRSQMPGRAGGWGRCCCATSTAARGSSAPAT